MDDVYVFLGVSCSREISIYHLDFVLSHMPIASFLLILGIRRISTPTVVGFKFNSSVMVHPVVIILTLMISSMVSFVPSIENTSMKYSILERGPVRH